MAIVGYAHEVNGRADPVGLADGRDVAETPGGLRASWAAGALIERLERPSGHAEADPSADVEVLELPVWEFGASGPLDVADFRTVVAAAVDALTSARADGVIDAVVVLGHGAGRTTDALDPDALDPDALDPDGAFLQAIRRTVGPDTAIVVVLDFHANLSARMCTAVDVVVGYRTNPHVDIADRLMEAAEHVHRLLGGGRTSIVHHLLPMVLPQIAQLTTSGEPLGEVVLIGQSRCVPPIRNVSVFGGFSLSDVPDSGASVCVTVDRGHEAVGVDAVQTLAQAIWARRDRYRIHATPLDAAVLDAARAASGDRSPVLLADVADNPGGGAPGNSTFVLRALLDARVAGVTMGMHCDPVVVEAAWRAGVGARLEVTFNQGSERPLALPLSVEATVLTLVDAPLVSTRGVYAGATRHPGRSCSLDLGGVSIGVSTRALQCADDDTLLHVGLRPAGSPVVVVKSRGHFRAGFDHLFTPEQIVEVGAPGVATPELHTVDWRHLRRPVFPLDDVVDPVFEPTVHRRTAETGTSVR